MRYVELFAGAGGLSMGLEAAGMVPVAHAEIEPHARAVLRHHWPDTPLHGDVTQVNWTQYAGQVDLVAGGSPCQDLSVAGKRAGLDGARSGLFYELIRAWDETGATYCLWENVDGARSSNGGKDFAAVLSAFVGAPVIVPRDGWASAGVVAGATGVAAWRVLDLQHFGPPQRRRRLFVLAAREGGVDPAKVLAFSEGVCGHPSPREQQRQGAARSAAAGARAGSAFPIDMRNATRTTEKSEQNRQSVGIGRADDSSPTLTSLFVPAVFAWDNELDASRETHGPRMARAKSGGDRNGVLAFTTTQTPKVGGDVAHTLEAASRSGGGQTPAVLAFDNRPQVMDDGSVNTLTTEGMRNPMSVVCTTGHITHALTHEGADASEDGTGRGTPIIAPAPIGAKYSRPRRLTPKECERLMGWPDQHTAHGVKEDGIAYALSDTARYRLCGNGVGTPVAAWIADRLVILEATV